MSQFLKDTGVQVPLICGAMYPCSNPELIAAVSAAGAMAIVQPVTLTMVYKMDFADGLRSIRSMTPHPIGLNVLTEKLNESYRAKNEFWVKEALRQGVRFFVTALGNPQWVVDLVHAEGGKVYHDVTELKWAEKAAAASVDGFICVNDRAGGHLGSLSPEELFRELSQLGKPLVCAGGVGTPEQFRAMIDLGYQGVQCGTRFIATKECRANDIYKDAIVRSSANDVVVTNRLSGVPVSVIETDYLKRAGRNVGFLFEALLKNHRTKHYARLALQVLGVLRLKNVHKAGANQDFWQAGKSVEGISSILPAGEVVSAFSRSLKT